MFSKCSNPDCDSTFDYRQGRLFRFDTEQADSKSADPCVRHFWLCEECSQTYDLECRRGMGVIIRSRVGNKMPRPVCDCLTADLGLCLAKRRVAGGLL